MDLDGFELRDAPQCMQDIAWTVDKAGAPEGNLSRERIESLGGSLL